MKPLLIVGRGDIARRVLARLPRTTRVAFVSRSAGRDLDRPETLSDLEAAEAILHTAPPPRDGITDPRTAHLLEALEQSRILPTRLVYISTSGVYGDRGGAWVDEQARLAPATDRARRRVDAEQQLERWCAMRGTSLVILRAPGIYAADRLPLARLRAGAPVPLDAEDVYTNHIHADDLAAIACRALEADAPSGTYNAADDSQMKMGDWLDWVAERAGLARPPRLPRAQIAARVSPELFSYMVESRRLDNRRMKAELGIALRYPTVFDGLPRETAVQP